MRARHLAAGKHHTSQTLRKVWCERPPGGTEAPHLPERIEAHRHSEPLATFLIAMLVLVITACTAVDAADLDTGAATPALAADVGCARATPGSYC